MERLKEDDFEEKDSRNDWRKRQVRKSIRHKSGSHLQLKDNCLLSKELGIRLSVVRLSKKRISMVFIYFRKRLKLKDYCRATTGEYLK